MLYGGGEGYSLQSSPLNSYHGGDAVKLSIGQFSLVAAHIIHWLAITMNRYQTWRPCYAVAIVCPTVHLYGGRMPADVTQSVLASTYVRCR